MVSTNIKNIVLIYILGARRLEVGVGPRLVRARVLKSKSLDLDPSLRHTRHSDVAPHLSRIDGERWENKAFDARPRRHHRSRPTPPYRRRNGVNHIRNRMEPNGNYSFPTSMTPTRCSISFCALVSACCLALHLSSIHPVYAPSASSARLRAHQIDAYIEYPVVFEYVRRFWGLSGRDRVYSARTATRGQLLDPSALERRRRDCHTPQIDL
ncbi:hypothetical protein CPB86DRAFT_456154 [Serendipita vermifera]|nr:hypothetical protein CPB86DRAFT_456154 [Serendipita vermifera]